MAYVYRHIRLDKNQPFYIGVGSDKYYQRAKSKDYRNDHWNNIITKTNYSIEIILDGLEREEAYNKEMEFISIYGRIDNGTGCLVNWTDGGEGIRNVSAETRKKMSGPKPNMVGKNTGSDNHNFGKPLPEHVRKQISQTLTGKKHSEETKKKMSISSKGKIISEETRKRMSACKIGNKGNSGKTFSDEWRAKISAAKRLRDLKSKLNRVP